MTKAGAGVVTTRAHVHWVATEHGVADLALTITCPSGGTPQLQEHGVARQFSCASFENPEGGLDVTRALAAGDERTVAMCKSRRYLFDHMDDVARAAFADAFEACGIDDDV